MRIGNIGVLDGIPSVLFDSGYLTANQQSFDIQGIDMNAHGNYELLVLRANRAGVASRADIRLNGDSGSSYCALELTGAGSSVYSTGGTGLGVGYSPLSESTPWESASEEYINWAFHRTMIFNRSKNTDGRRVMMFSDFVNGIRNEYVNASCGKTGCSWASDQQNVTSIQLVGTAAGTFGAGSRVILMRTPTFSKFRAGKVTPVGKNGAWKLVGRGEVSSAGGATSISVTGLDGDAHGGLYRVVVCHTHNGNGYSNLQFNGAARQSGLQDVYAGASTVGAERYNNLTSGLTMSSTYTDKASFSEHLVWVKSGRNRIALGQVLFGTQTTANGITVNTIGQGNSGTDNVTQIDLVATSANILGLRSFLEVYKLNS